VSFDGLAMILAVTALAAMPNPGFDDSSAIHLFIDAH
jgi:hypothetical protein